MPFSPTKSTWACEFAFPSGQCTGWLTSCSYDDVVKDYQVTYVAGGAAQNAARAAAYVLPPNHVVYVGAVGKDELAEQLQKANEKEGVVSAYQVVEDDKTGACAVVLTGHDR